MKYYIGIDGGGTKSSCVIVDENKKQLFEGTGGPTNTLTIGIETASRTVIELVKQCKEKTNINYNQIDAVLIGSAGAGRRQDAQLFEAGVKTAAVEANVLLKNVFVESDAIIALEGAFNSGAGCILISGTGSIMFGKDEKDKLYRIGGFGRNIGDEGSGYQLGKRGLKAVAYQLDGRGEPTLITNLVQTNHQITTINDLITAAFSSEFDIASVSRAVLQAAEQGDSCALSIVTSEVDELILHIRTMERKIAIKNLEVCFSGSLITNDNIFSKMLRTKISEIFPDVRIKGAKSSPAFGAVLLAMRRISNI